METYNMKSVDIHKLNEALEQFGSLQKANAQLEEVKEKLKKENENLHQENANLISVNSNLAAQTKEKELTLKNLQDQGQSLYTQINEHKYQYDLVCGLISMITGSPSVTDSVNILVNTFQKLKGPGWAFFNDADEFRSLFVRVVMGDYLKCFRCDTCGARFIINKKPKNKILGYCCSACHNSYAVKSDDSFLKAMVSKQQLENTHDLGKIFDDYEALLPFKVFLKEPCEFCHEPITEWDEYNVKLAIQGIGFGHTFCWESDVGRFRELRKALEKMK